MTRLLDGVEYPRDIRAFTIEELNQLAAEIREEVISVVSEVGGHFASTLGAVELTLALHYVFDTPEDRIVWDTGHQAYAHKLLCGRRNRLSTIRQFGGLSGFLSREESEYDVFGAGHAGTSISAALGMVEAKYLEGSPRKVVAVISDGGLSAGLTYEGLNSAGHLDRDLIVVLNDNEHFIDPRVGAVSSFLSKQFTTDLGVRLQKNLSNLAEELAERRKLEVYGAQDARFFLEFGDPGFSVREPGLSVCRSHRWSQHQRNDLDSRKYQEGRRSNSGSCDDKEGQGLRSGGGRSDQISRRHTVSRAHRQGQKRKRTDSDLHRYFRPIARAHRQRKIRKSSASRRPWAAARVSTSSGAKFPKRTYDVGIAEQHAVTFAAGMATEGYIPVVAIYSTFLQRGYDEILHDVCLQNLHVVFALDRGGLVGADGPTHHGVFDFSYLRSMPNIVVMAPKDENELQHMLATAVDSRRADRAALSARRGLGRRIGCRALSPGDRQGGVAARRQRYCDRSDRSHGHAGAQGGSRSSAAWESTPQWSTRASSNRSILICCATLLTRVPRLITVEDHVISGGFGSAVIEFLADEGINGVEIRRLGVPDRFIPHGTQDELRKLCGFDKDAIAQAVLQMVRRGKKRSREGWERGSA